MSTKLTSVRLTRKIRIRDNLKIFVTRVESASLYADPDSNFHFNADPDPAFHFNADPDPAPHQSDVNLRPLV